MILQNLYSASEFALGEGMATHSSILAWRIPTDRGAWWATVHRVTKRLTQLKWLSMHTCNQFASVVIIYQGAPPMAQRVKNPPAVQETQETWVQFLDWEDPLEEEMAIHCSILAWKIPWTEEPGGLQSMRSQRVRHAWATKHMSWLQSCPYVANFFHLVGASVSIRQFTWQGLEYYL